MGLLKCGLISFIVTQCLSASIHGRVNEGSKKKKRKPRQEEGLTLSTTIESEPDLKSTFY